MRRRERQEQRERERDRAQLEAMSEAGETGVTIHRWAG
jgi:hypothetical protein